MTFKKNDTEPAVVVEIEATDAPIVEKKEEKDEKFNYSNYLDAMQYAINLLSTGVAIFTEALDKCKEAYNNDKNN